MPTHGFRSVGVGSRSGMDGVKGPGKMLRVRGRRSVSISKIKKYLSERTISVPDLEWALAEAEPILTRGDERVRSRR